MKPTISGLQLAEGGDFQHKVFIRRTEVYIPAKLSYEARNRHYAKPLLGAGVFLSFIFGILMFFGLTIT